MDWILVVAMERYAQISLIGGTPVTMASGQQLPAGIAIDASSVYWTDGGSLGGATGTVMRIAKTGGPAVTLASAQKVPEGLAVDATNVYWVDGNGGTVWKIAK